MFRKKRFTRNQVRYDKPDKASPNPELVMS